MSTNTLFNQPLMNKYLKKYQKEFKLTHSRKEALFKWIEKLENNELKDEVSNYGHFSRLIMEKILGYDYEENIIENVKEDYGRGLSEFALKKDNKKFMVIELKGSDADLDKPQNRKNDKRTPVDQAFDYAKRSGDINWIFVSNYNEFRLYNWHKKQHQYISFKAEDLKDPETFKKFMLVFSKFSTVENNLIDKLVSKTIFVERDLEDEFYKLYNETRLMLIAEIEYLNPEFTREQSVHYSQLILNRYIFICFAEDLGLLPEEISVESIENPVKNNNLGRTEIWHRLNSLFIDVNEGNDFKKIYGYNGGLFHEDIEFLKIRDIIEDHSIFSDAYQKWKFEEYSLIVEEKLSPYSAKINPIYKNLMTISTFNFSSEVDVNILGHIFENSIGDIEELKADTKGRRKKDGIFYTPEHITDYICRNTIIPYLSKSGNDNTVQKLISEYSGSEIEELDEKVKKIKIVDPACGSGAFLNKAGDVLLELHEAIRKYKYKDDNTLMPFFDSIEERRKILLNNIYGVDLNEESVEITKLSLFLKVCKEGLKLPNLDNNIKCGNSLINDPEYTDKPFNWEEEFKTIFDNGGFDVIIGNPPYVRNTDLLNEEKNFFKTNYIGAYKQYDLYVLFFELGLKILKNDGYLGFITSNKFLATDYGKKLRNLLLQNSKINALIDVSYLRIFKDASTYPVIALLQKELNNLERENNEINFHKIENIIDLNQNHDISTVKQSEFNYGGNNRLLDISSPEFKIIKKIDAYSVKLNEIFSCQRGSPKNKIKLINEKSDLSISCITSTSINRYTHTISDDIFVISNLQDKILSIEKILLPRTVLNIKATYESGGNFIMDRIYYLMSKNNENINLKYATLILNSKIIDFYYKINFSSTHIGGGYLDLKGTQIEELPIKIISKDNALPFIEKADKMLKLNEELINEINGFINWLKITYSIDKLSKKLDKYYKLPFDDFLIELKKKKVDTKPRKTQELLKKEFEESLIKINPLLHDIEETDNEIDQMVYELYGLTDEEIKIIENSLN